MPRKEHRIETRTTHGSGNSVIESRLNAEGSGKSTAKREEVGGTEAEARTRTRTRTTHGSGDCYVV